MGEQVPVGERGQRRRVRALLWAWNEPGVDDEATARPRAVRRPDEELSGVPLHETHAATVRSERPSSLLLPCKN